LIKKLVSLLLVVLFLTVLSFSLAFADDLNNVKDMTMKSKLELLQKKYNIVLSDVKVLPPGIEPQKFSSVEEFEKYLMERQVNNKNFINLKEVRNEPNEQINNNNIVSTLDSSGKLIHRKHVHFSAWLNILVKFDYVYNNYYQRNQFTSCNSVDSWYDGYSVPTGYEWEQKDYSAQILDGGRTLAVTITGVEKQYILIENVLQIMSSTVNYYDEFYYNEI